LDYGEGFGFNINEINEKRCFWNGRAIKEVKCFVLTVDSCQDEKMPVTAWHTVSWFLPLRHFFTQ
jgi:hypothetical protein